MPTSFQSNSYCQENWSPTQAHFPWIYTIYIKGILIKLYMWQCSQVIIPESYHLGEPIKFHSLSSSFPFHESKWTPAWVSPSYPSSIVLYRGMMLVLINFYSTLCKTVHISNSFLLFNSKCLIQLYLGVWGMGWRVGHSWLWLQLTTSSKRACFI